MQLFIQTRNSVDNDIDVDVPWVVTVEYKGTDGADIVNRAINALNDMAATMAANTGLRLHVHDHDRDFAVGWVGGCRVLEYSRRGGKAAVVRDNLTRFMQDNPQTRDDIDNKIPLNIAAEGRGSP
jgi:hypothetical protein